MSRKALAVRRSFSALLWGVGCFIAAQLGLLLALSLCRPLGDPEYGVRLVQLRERLAERPGRPLVVVLGSSRVAMGLRPGEMTGNSSAGSAALVFNMGQCQAGPMMQLLALKRLLADGIHPDAVIAELYPHLLPTRTGEDQLVSVDRLSWKDLETLGPYYTDAKKLRKTWLRQHLIPWHGERLHLINQWAPEWLPVTKRKNREWEGVDDWGWLMHPVFADDPALSRNDLRTRIRLIGHHFSQSYLQVGEDFVTSDLSRRALRELSGLCSQQHIRLALLLMPDPFLTLYPPRICVRMDDMVRQLSQDLDRPVIDARSWAKWEDFFEGVHLTHQGAAMFSRRFEKELRPWLDGRAVTLAAPGHLETPCLEHWGPQFQTEEIHGDAILHWCDRSGEITLINTSDHPRRCCLRFLARTPGGAARLSVHSPVGNWNEQISAQGTAVKHSLELPPGLVVLRFICDGQSVPAENGNKVFGLSGFLLEEQGGQRETARAKGHSQSPSLTR
jgi:hypothetical protein